MTEEIADVIAVGLPDVVTPEIINDPGLCSIMLERLTDEAWKSVWSQWTGRLPIKLTNEWIDWLITRDPNEVDEFQPAHDCENCRMGNVKAREFLAEYPHRYIALGNIHYVPVWEIIL